MTVYARGVNRFALSLFGVIGGCSEGSRGSSSGDSEASSAAASDASDGATTGVVPTGDPEPTTSGTSVAGATTGATDDVTTAGWTGTSAADTTGGPVDPTKQDSSDTSIDTSDGDTGDATTGDVPGDPCDPATPLAVGPLPGPHTGRVTAVYMVPADQAIDETRAKFYRCAVHVVDGWYQQRAGRSYNWELSVVQSAHAAGWFACEEANTLAQCSTQIGTQLAELGYPLYSDHTMFAVALQGNLVQWGGARVDSPAGGGLAFVGADLFTQLTDKNCLPGACMTFDIKLNIFHDGDYVTGGIAHEFGHAFGLPHPDPMTPGVAWSIMAEHWHYPNNGFLDGELASLATNPLLAP